MLSESIVSPKRGTLRNLPLLALSCHTAPGLKQRPLFHGSRDFSDTRMLQNVDVFVLTHALILP